MGALIGFELARELRRRGVANPTHLFVSACRAPQLPDPDPPIHALPRAELLREIQKLNGTPPELLENSELMDLVLPTLRADAELTETYVHETGVPFAWPITAFGGIRDPKLTENDLSAWSRHTSERFTLHMFEGDHFFIHTAPQGMLKAIGDSLARPAVP
jgi:medium-chain acyl-[acyl-carrier-protein] hydrolase